MDFVILAKNEDIPLIRYNLSNLVFLPINIHILTDDLIFAEKMLHDVHPSLYIHNLKRFPFTIDQVAIEVGNIKMAKEYRTQLIYLYCSEVLSPLSDYYFVMDANIVIKGPIELFYEGNIPCYTWSHGCYLPYFLHMKKLHPSFEKMLVNSAISPFFILNKHHVQEMMEMVAPNKSFWKVYLNNVDRHQRMGASYQELYLNFIAKYHYKEYHLKKIEWTESVLDKLTTLPPSIYSCPPVICKDIYEKLYTSLWAMVPLVQPTPPSSPLLVPYLTYLKQIIQDISPNDHCTIIDIGCGNFSLAFPYIPWSLEKTTYIGIDCSSTIIEYNKTTFKNEPSLHFICQDITTSLVPKGTICLVRNILQYLCFVHIHAIIHQLKHTYDYILFTDDLPIIHEENRINQDKPTNGTTRSTGLWLELPPFSLPVTSVLDLPIDKTRISRTVFLKKNNL